MGEDVSQRMNVKERRMRNKRLAEIIVDPSDLDARVHYAALSGDIETLRRLIGNEAECVELIHRQIKPLGASPLRLAATGDHVDVIRYLISLGVDIDSLDYKGQTPLFAAVYNGCFDSATVLLDHGANPNGNIMNSCSPLCAAVQNGLSDFVLLLLKYGAATEMYDRIMNCNKLVPKGFLGRIIRPRMAGLDCPPPSQTPLLKSLSNAKPDCFLALLAAGAATDLRLLVPSLPDVVVEELSLSHAIIRKSTSGYIAKMLVLFGGYLWQCDTHGQLAVQLDHNNDLVPSKQVFAHYMSNPLELQHLCRICIRRHLGHNRLSAITALPLPKHILDFLHYKMEIPECLLTYR